MCCIKVGSVGGTALNICQNVGLVARSGPGPDSDLCESKNLANFLMKFLIQNAVSFLCSSSPGAVLLLSNVGQLLLSESFVTHPSLKKVTYCSLKILAKAHWKRGLHIVCIGARAKPMSLVYDSGTGIRIIWRDLFLESWLWPIVATFLVLFLIY